MTGGLWRRFLVVVFAAVLAGAVLSFADGAPVLALLAPPVFLVALSMLDRVFPR